MNRIEALETTQKLWKWLALNPSKEKGDWPEWALYYHDDDHCPLCTYSKGQVGSWREGGTNRHDPCVYCPLGAYWNTFVQGPTTFHCHNRYSPYKVWKTFKHSPMIRKAAAWEIYHFCTSALATLHAEEEARRRAQEVDRIKREAWGPKETFRIQSSVCKQCGRPPSKKGLLCPACQSILKFERYNYYGKWETYSCPKCYRKVVTLKGG